MPPPQKGNTVSLFLLAAAADVRPVYRNTKQDKSTGFNPDSPDLFETPRGR